MPKVNVVLKSGAVVTVEGADSADWKLEPRFPGATGQLANTTRLVCKQGEQLVGRFNSDDIAGYSVDLR